MTEGVTEVIRDGREGMRNVLYKIFYVNGKVDERKVITPARAP